MFILTKLDKYIIKKIDQPNVYVSRINSLDYGFSTTDISADDIKWEYINKSQVFSLHINRFTLANNENNICYDINHEYYLLYIGAYDHKVCIEPAIFYYNCYYVKIYKFDDRLSMTELDIIDSDFQNMLELCFRRLKEHDYYNI